MPHRCLRLLLTVLLTVCLSACVFVPVTKDTYDPECRIMSRTLELQPVQMAALNHCSNQDCAGLLVVIGATAAASAVVSGSIVLVGNVAYWIERQGRCFANRGD
jgi:hypothetical protein